MKERRCGTCKFLRVTPDKSGRRVVRKANTYLCIFQPVWPPLPDSMTKSGQIPVPTPWYMDSTQGTECPVWEEYK